MKTAVFAVAAAWGLGGCGRLDQGGGLRVTPWTPTVHHKYVFTC